MEVFIRITKSDRVFIWLQASIWAFVLFVSTVNKTYEVSFLTSFFMALITVAHAMWVVYGHIFLALPYLTPKKEYFKYGLMTAFIIGSGILVTSLAFLEYYPFTGPCEKEATPVSIVISGLIESFFYIILSTPIKFSYDYFKLHSQHQKLAGEKLKAELNYLKLQINPHFLFNTLNNLLFLTRKKSDMAPTVVEKLSHLMRYMLETSQQEKIYLQSEIEFIRAYIELEKLRIKDIEVHMKTSGIDGQITIPPMLLLTLVENAFKHGIDKTIKNYISVGITVSDGYLDLTVRNQVVDDSAKIRLDNEGAHIGLENLKKRLELTYQKDYHLRLKQENLQFEANLKIPVQ